MNDWQQYKDKIVSVLHDLQENHGRTDLTTTELSEILDLPEATTIHLLNELLSEDVVENGGFPK